MKNFLLTILSLFVCLGMNAQSTIEITTSGGSFPGEKWVSITTAIDGGGTQVWGQGNGTQCDGAGLLTNEMVSIAPGTYYVNCYDQYDDSWDGTLISVTAYGSVIGDNGGVSPTDGADTDASSACEGTAEEFEASFVIVVPAPPSCVLPSTLTASNITTSSADLGWTTGGSGETAWEVAVQAPGTGVPAGAGSAATNPYSATALTGSTDYEFYVRADCGASGFSDWAGPFNFTTLTDYCALGSFTDSGGTTGDYGNNELTTTVICPDTPGDVVTVDFTSVALETCCDDLSVYNGTGTATVLNGDLIAPETFLSSAADGCITVVFDSDGSVTDAGWEATVTCSPPPSCLVPSALTSANIMATSAELAWTSGGSGETTWEVAVQAAGTGVPTAAGTSTTMNPYTDNALSPETDYEFYVRADCGGGEFSDWSGPSNFTTPPSCLAPTALASSSITQTSAELAWTSGGSGETTWEVAVQAAGTGEPTAAGTSTTMNPYTDNALSSGTDYEFYVRADCGGGDFSAWSGPMTFTTLPDYCAGDSFTDSGGATGNYSSGENITTVICPDTPGDIVSVAFSSFDVEGNGAGNCYDELLIYDGADASAPIIPSGGASSDGWCYESATDGTADLAGQTIVSSDASGCLTFVFTSDGSVTGAGWEATVTCVTPVVNDDCDTNPISLNGAAGPGTPTDGTIPATTVGATASAAMPAPCSGGNADDDVWFTFVTDSDGGDVTISIVPDNPATFAPVCEVFAGPACPTMSSVADACGGATTVIPTAGTQQTYFVRVYDSGAANFTGGGAEERSAGGFTIAAAGSALPAELTSFTGKAMNKYNTLKWETASEQNTSEFAIERSLDGRTNWEVIGTEKATGNSDVNVTYSFDDMRPVSHAYYRLNTIDLDGSAQTSNIISIKRAAADFDVVLVAPNPTTSKTVVTFESSKDANVNAVVTDITGKVISTLTQDAISGLNNMTIDLSNTPSGVYFLTMNNGVNNITRRIVKN